MGDELIFSEDKLTEFWKFVHERHQIFIKRFVEKRPKPWTLDPILRDYKFTNVFRELDRGTLWVKQEVLENDLLEDHDKVFWTMAYRMGITKEVLDIHGLRRMDGPNSYALKDLRKLMFKLQNEGHHVWTNAYMVGGVRYAGSPSKIINLVKGILEDVVAPKVLSIVDSFRIVPNLKQAHGIIRSIDSFADFLAYEVVVDLMYPDGILWRRGFTEDDWVNPGPGCRRGIEAIVINYGWADYVDIIKVLRKNQDEDLKEIGLSPIRHAGRDLTLRNIEHSLCEFSKYNRMKNGGHKTRKFIASKEDLVFQ